MRCVLCAVTRPSPKVARWHGDDTVFLIKKLITALILPPTSIILITMCGLLLLDRKPRLGRALAWCGLLSLLVLSLPPVSVLLARAIGDSAPLDRQLAASAQAILVPGGGLR